MMRLYIFALMGIATMVVILTGCQRPLKPDEDKILQVAKQMGSHGDKTKALQAYRDVLAKSDHKFPLYDKISDTLMASEDYQSAHALLEESLPHDEKSQLKIKLAKCYLLEGLTDKALPLYQQLAHTHPDNAQCYNGLGLTLTMKGDDHAAFKAYQQALSLEPHNVEYQSNYGLALALKGDHSKALEYLKPIGSSPEATSRQRHNLAFAYGLLGDEQQARTLYRRDLSDAHITKNLQTIRQMRISFGSQPPAPSVTSYSLDRG